MGDLEKHAIRRDRRFLVRLALVLMACLLASMVALSCLEGVGVGSFAAEQFEVLSGEEATGDGASNAPSPP